MNELKEFKNWHKETSRKNWGLFPKRLPKFVKIRKGYWYWKGYKVKDLYDR